MSTSSEESDSASSSGYSSYGSGDTSDTLVESDDESRDRWDAPAYDEPDEYNGIERPAPSELRSHNQAERLRVKALRAAQREALVEVRKKQDAPNAPELSAFDRLVQQVDAATVGLRAVRHRHATDNGDDGTSSSTNTFALPPELADDTETTLPPWMGGRPRPYQIDGVNWILEHFEAGINGILADEMGLGKTFQTVVSLGALLWGRRLGGPHLVVAPLSVKDVWIRECAKWCPGLRTMSLHARKEDLADCLDELAVRSANGSVDVCVTTYEFLRSHINKIKKIPFRVMVIDEAHRNKNDQSQSAAAARAVDCQCRLLITGTPLQNDLRELWALLNFLFPELFCDADSFESWFSRSDDSGTADDTSVIRRLHKVLQPFMIRRLKSDTDHAIPPKTEILVETPLTRLQKQLYKEVYGNVAAMDRRAGGKLLKSRLQNQLMQLRKVCNHPYLLPDIEPSDAADMLHDGAHLYEAAGKTIVLVKLLTRLKAGGHRVLIFSGMVQMLLLLSRIMQFLGMKHMMLDGSTPVAERVAMQDAFNPADSDVFGLLISTRAGGLGITLTGADTVVLYDSDWNPHQDVQAMDRAHRIGQTRPVTVFRFITANTVEEKVYRRALRKLYLDRRVVQSGRGGGGNEDDTVDALASVIRFGADAMLSADGEGGDDTVDPALAISDAEIDALLTKGAAAAADAARNAREEAGGRAGGDVLALGAEEDLTFANECFSYTAPTKIVHISGISRSWRSPAVRVGDGVTPATPKSLPPGTPRPLAGANTPLNRTTSVGGVQAQALSTAAAGGGGPSRSLNLGGGGAGAAAADAGAGASSLRAAAGAIGSSAVGGAAEVGGGAGTVQPLTQQGTGTRTSVTGGSELTAAAVYDILRRTLQPGRATVKVAACRTKIAINFRYLSDATRVRKEWLRECPFTSPPGAKAFETEDAARSAGKTVIDSDQGPSASATAPSQAEGMAADGAGVKGSEGGGGGDVEMRTSKESMPVAQAGGGSDAAATAAAVPSTPSRPVVVAVTGPGTPRARDGAESVDHSNVAVLIRYLLPPRVLSQTAAAVLEQQELARRTAAMQFAQAASRQAEAIASSGAGDEPLSRHLRYQLVDAERAAALRQRRIWNRRAVLEAKEHAARTSLPEGPLIDNANTLNPPLAAEEEEELALATTRNPHGWMTHRVFRAFREVLLRHPREQWEAEVGKVVSRAANNASRGGPRSGKRHGGEEGERGGEAEAEGKDGDEDGKGEGSSGSGSGTDAEGRRKRGRGGGGGSDGEGKGEVTAADAVAYLNAFLANGEELMPQEYGLLMRRIATLEAQRAKSGRVLELHRLIPEYKAGGLRAWQGCPVPRRALSAFAQFMVYPPPIRLEAISSRPTEGCVDLDSVVRVAHTVDAEWHKAVSAIEQSAAEKASEKERNKSAAAAVKGEADEEVVSEGEVSKGDVEMAKGAGKGDADDAAKEGDAANAVAGAEGGNGKTLAPPFSGSTAKAKVLQLRRVDDSKKGGDAVGSSGGPVVRSAVPRKEVSGAFAIDHSVAGESGTFKHALVHDVDRLLLAAAAVRPDPEDMHKVLRGVPEGVFTWTLKVAPPAELWRRVQKMSADLLGGSERKAGASKGAAAGAGADGAGEGGKKGKGRGGAAAKAKGSAAVAVGGRRGSKSAGAEGDTRAILRPAPVFKVPGGEVEDPWIADGEAEKLAEAEAKEKEKEEKARAKKAAAAAAADAKEAKEKAGAAGSGKKGAGVAAKKGAAAGGRGGGRASTAKGRGGAVAKGGKTAAASSGKGKAGDSKGKTKHKSDKEKKIAIVLDDDDDTAHKDMDVGAVSDGGSVTSGKGDGEGKTRSGAAAAAGEGSAEKSKPKPCPKTSKSPRVPAPGALLLKSHDDTSKSAKRSAAGGGAAGAKAGAKGGDGATSKPRTPRAKAEDGNTGGPSKRPRAGGESEKMLKPPAKRADGAGAGAAGGASVKTAGGQTTPPKFKPEPKRLSLTRPKAGVSPAGAGVGTPSKLGSGGGGGGPSPFSLKTTTPTRSSNVAGQTSSSTAQGAGGSMTGAGQLSVLTAAAKASSSVAASTAAAVPRAPSGAPATSAGSLSRAPTSTSVASTAQSAPPAPAAAAPPAAAPAPAVSSVSAAVASTAPPPAAASTGAGGAGATAPLGAVTTTDTDVIELE